MFILQSSPFSKVSDFEIWADAESTVAILTDGKIEERRGEERRR
jgi:hypothetical protein